ncbi:MAG: hypothetical protein EXR62_17065 [Chloroflexi bacterium]|nr:hypothetical protein [Chloroflexota bacterium]
MSSDTIYLPGLLWLALLWIVAGSCGRYCLHRWGFPGSGPNRSSVTVPVAPAGLGQELWLITQAGFILLSFPAYILSLLSWLSLPALSAAVLLMAGLLLLLGHLSAVPSAAEEPMLDNLQNCSSPATLLFLTRSLRRRWRGLYLDDISAIWVVALLLAVTFYSRTAETLPTFLDPGWYLNSALRLARTGGLIETPSLWSQLTPTERAVFSDSFDVVQTRLPIFPAGSQAGFFLTSFTFPDLSHPQIMPYHPPLLTVWLAVLAQAGGPRAALLLPPFLSLLSLVSFYLVVARLWRPAAGGLAVLLLGLSLPQIFYSRETYAEILTQFLLWSALACLLAYAHHRPALGPPFLDAEYPQPDSAAEPWGANVLGRNILWAVMGGLLLGLSLPAKLESVLVLLPVGLWWIWGCWQKLFPRRDLLISCAALLPGIVLAACSALAVNQVYLFVNGFGVLARALVFLGNPLLWLVLAAVLILLLFLWRLRAKLSPFGTRSLRGTSRSGADPPIPGSSGRGPLKSEVMRLAGMYAIVLLSLAEYFLLQPGGGPASTPAVPSGLVLSAAHITPILTWLGVLGLAWRWRRARGPAEVLFLAFSLTYFLVITLAPTISAGLSGLYAVRRQLPVVLPALCAGCAALVFTWEIPPAWRTWRQILALTLVIFALLPALFILRVREMRGTWQFQEQLNSTFAAGDIVVFEPLDRESEVGYFAAPLWSMGSAQVFLARQVGIQPGGQVTISAPLAAALQKWLDARHTVWYVSAQANPGLSQAGLRGELVTTLEWAAPSVAPEPVTPGRLTVIQTAFYIFRLK